ADGAALNPGPADPAGHRVRDLRADDLGLHAGHRVGDLLGDRLGNHPGHRVRDLLDAGVRNLLADRVRNLLVDGFLDVGRAGNGLADGVLLPDLAAADLVGALLAALDPLTGLVVALAGARVEAALAALPVPGRLGLAGDAVLLGHPLAALLGDGLA